MLRNVAMVRSLLPLPDLQAWSEERLADNAPRLVRPWQLMALFKAFGIPWNISLFRDGGFITEDRPRSSLLQRAAAEMRAEHSDRHGQTADDLPMLFSILLGFREDVEQTLRSSTGMEASGLLLWAHQKIRQANDTIRQAAQPIDEILVELISSDGKRFALPELIQDYGYPADDLDQIDEDWW